MQLHKRFSLLYLREMLICIFFYDFWLSYWFFDLHFYAICDIQNSPREIFCFLNSVFNLHHFSFLQQAPRMKYDLQVLYKTWDLNFLSTYGVLKINLRPAQIFFSQAMWDLYQQQNCCLSNFQFFNFCPTKIWN